MAPPSSSIVLALATLKGVQAWGTLGHQTIAYIAQNYVSDTTATWAQGILADTSDSYLANVATWADSYRYTTEGTFSAPYHYIDAEDSPPTDCNVDYDRDCGSAGCSVSAIANYTQRVADGGLSTADTAIALKFIVHLLGDITQPLHDEALETGGNGITVTFDGYDDDNLHSIWDTWMPGELIGGDELSDALAWAGDLATQIDSGDYASQAASWIAGDDISAPVDSAMTWATDANAYVCTVVMPDGVAALQEDDLLTNGYYDSAVPTIELQIAKGGYRLANWLNLIADANLARKRDEKSGIVSRYASQPLDLSGRDLLPPPRPLSKAKLARKAIGYGCGDHTH